MPEPCKEEKKRECEFVPPVTERQDGFQSCSQCPGSDRRTKHPCEELAASSAAALSPKGECPQGIGSPQDCFLSSPKIWHRHSPSPAL